MPDRDAAPWRRPGRWLVHRLARARSGLLVFVHDLLMIPVAWGLTYWTRFNLAYVPPEFIAAAFEILPLAVVVMGTVYWAFGLYRGVWRFASLTDLERITQAVLTGTTLLLLVLFLLDRMAFVPRSLPVLFVLYQLLLLAGPRLLYRWLKDRRLDFGNGPRVLIVGAGEAGERLVRELLRDRRAGYVPIGFVDDRPRRQGALVHGVPVRGTSAEIPALVESFQIDLIVLAVPGVSVTELRRLVELCEPTGRPLRLVAPAGEVLTGQREADRLRPVAIEDLLGREPVTLDWAGLGRGLAGRVVLVSGAGGSIGSELCRQVLRAGPAHLVLIDHSEYNLYRIETELRDSGGAPLLTRRLLDVTNADRLAALFAQTRPQVVFHAAAYKHVPLLEDQLGAALHNNVLGTRAMLAAAEAAGCERFVLISTDKAVYPGNVMGASKRLAELLCLAAAQRGGGRFMLVRFGNVLGSAGSVVPRFREQIARGGPVTVTHPEMERFFMTIPEACQLIMQAAVIGEGGETFVLDMGEPVKIRDLAEQMIRLSGREPGRDVEIVYTGLRPGEKLSEELFYAAEDFAPTSHPKIRVVRDSGSPLPGRVEAALDDLRQALAADDEAALRRLLAELLQDWRGVKEAAHS